MSSAAVVIGALRVKYFFIVFQRKLILHMNPLPDRGFTSNIKPYFFLKDKSKNKHIIKVSSAAI